MPSHLNPEQVAYLRGGSRQLKELWWFICRSESWLAPKASGWTSSSTGEIPNYWFGSTPVLARHIRRTPIFQQSDVSGKKVMDHFHLWAEDVHANLKEQGLVVSGWDFSAHRILFLSIVGLIFAVSLASGFYPTSPLSIAIGLGVLLVLNLLLRRPSKHTPSKLGLAALKQYDQQHSVQGVKTSAPADQRAAIDGVAWMGSIAVWGTPFEAWAWITPSSTQAAKGNSCGSGGCGGTSQSHGDGGGDGGSGCGGGGGD